MKKNEKLSEEIREINERVYNIRIYDVANLMHAAIELYRNREWDEFGKAGKTVLTVRPRDIENLLKAMHELDPWVMAIALAPYSGEISLPPNPPKNTSPR
jgi:hypothetical protein